MNAQDIYLKTEDPTGKSSSVVSHHRVWDRDLFIKSQAANFSKKRDTPDFRVVTPTDETEYRKANGYKGF